MIILDAVMLPSCLESYLLPWAQFELGFLGDRWYRWASRHFWFPFVPTACGALEVYLLLLAGFWCFPVGCDRRWFFLFWELSMLPCFNVLPLFCCGEHSSILLLCSLLDSVELSSFMTLLLGFWVVEELSSSVLLLVLEVFLELACPLIILFYCCWVGGFVELNFILKIAVNCCNLVVVSSL